MILTANWPAPAHIKACTTLRRGGISLPPYDEFNLGDHVGDDEQCVSQNRQILKHNLNLPNEPIWLNQTHSTMVVKATPDHLRKEADASYSNQPGQVCVVLTADCLPLLLCNAEGSYVAAIHAGWRGLANGIIEQTFSHLPKQDWLAWLGPAIGPTHFEVGNEVRDIFINRDPGAEIAFAPSPQGRWLADIYQLARLRLQQLGVSQIYGGESCTYSDKENFYSYRRDGAKTGRMASLIWIAEG